MDREIPDQAAYTRVRHIDELDAYKQVRDIELEEIAELAAMKIKKPVGD